MERDFESYITKMVFIQQAKTNLIEAKKTKFESIINKALDFNDDSYVEFAVESMVNFWKEMGE